MQKNSESCSDVKLNASKKSEELSSTITSSGDKSVSKTATQPTFSRKSSFPDDEDDAKRKKRKNYNYSNIVKFLKKLAFLENTCHALYCCFMVEGAFQVIINTGVLIYFL